MLKWVLNLNWMQKIIKGVQRVGCNQGQVQDTIDKLEKTYSSEF